MATKPASEEAVIFAACVQAAASLHKEQVLASDDKGEHLARLAVEYYEEAMAVWVAGDD